MTLPHEREAEIWDEHAVREAILEMRDDLAKLVTARDETIEGLREQLHEAREEVVSLRAQAAIAAEREVAEAAEVFNGALAVVCVHNLRDQFQPVCQPTCWECRGRGLLKALTARVRELETRDE